METSCGTVWLSKNLFVDDNDLMLTRWQDLKQNLNSNKIITHSSTHLFHNCKCSIQSIITHPIHLVFDLTFDQFHLKKKKNCYFFSFHQPKFHYRDRQIQLITECNASKSTRDNHSTSKKNWRLRTRQVFVCRECWIELELLKT